MTYRYAGGDWTIIANCEIATKPGSVAFGRYYHWILDVFNTLWMTLQYSVVASQVLCGPWWSIPLYIICSYSSYNRLVAALLPFIYAELHLGFESVWQPPTPCDPWHISVPQTGELLVMWQIVEHSEIRQELEYVSIVFFRWHILEWQVFGEYTVYSQKRTSREWPVCRGSIFWLAHHAIFDFSHIDPKLKYIFFLHSLLIWKPHVCICSKPTATPL